MVRSKRRKGRKEGVITQCGEEKIAGEVEEKDEKKKEKNQGKERKKIIQCR